MRVLHVNNYHRGIGGSDIYCNVVINMCRQRGLDVEVYSKSSRDLPKGMRGKLIAFFSGIYAKNSIDEFDSKLKSFKPDVVHVHELFPLISPWVLTRCSDAGIPVVMTCYDFRITCPVATHYTQGHICHDCIGGKEYNSVLNNCRHNIPESIAFGLRSAVARKFKLFTDHVTKFIVFTEFSKQWIERHVGIAPERVATIPCAVKTPEEYAKDPSQGKYVAYAGRFAEEKGVEIIIQACRKIGLPLRLAGDSLTHPAIRADDDIMCVSTSEPGALKKFYCGARMIVAASIWEETFATVTSEAKSHGIPVVVPAIGALPDLIEDEKTGLLFEPANVDQLAEKIKRVWNDAELCRRLGTAGRIDVQKTLNEDICFSQLLSVYDDVTGKPSLSLTA